MSLLSIVSLYIWIFTNIVYGATFQGDVIAEYQGQILNCGNSANCNVQCTAEDSCKGATINCPDDDACDVSCSGTSSCRNIEINCPENAKCTLDCPGSSSCVNAEVYGGDSQEMSIQCRGTNGCKNALFDARDSSKLTIQNCDVTGSCVGQTIYCPPWNGGVQCNIAGNSDMGGTTDNPLTLYAVNGWIDIDITRQSTTRNGILYCQSDYNTKCDIWNTGVGANDVWKCDGGWDDCIDYPAMTTSTSTTTEEPDETTNEPTNDPTNDPTVDPTNDPTNDPTTDPTNDPTADPTTDPTNDPTNDPTQDPTSMPNLNPTSIPTTAIPSYGPTYSPITSTPTSRPTSSCNKFNVTIKSLSYTIKDDADLSFKIDEYIQNKTNDFIQQNVTQKTECTLIDHETTVTQIIDNEATVHMFACFDCSKVADNKLNINDDDIDDLEKDYVDIFTEKLHIEAEVEFDVDEVDPDGEVTSRHPTVAPTSFDDRNTVNKENSSFWTIIGVCIGLIFLCIICLVIVFIYRWKKHKSVNDKKNKMGVMFHMNVMQTMQGSTDHIGEIVEDEEDDDDDTGTNELNSVQDTDSNMITAGGDDVDDGDIHHDTHNEHDDALEFIVEDDEEMIERQTTAGNDPDVMIKVKSLSSMLEGGINVDMINNDDIIIGDDDDDNAATPQFESDHHNKISIHLAQENRRKITKGNDDMKHDDDDEVITDPPTDEGDTPNEDGDSSDMNYDDNDELLMSEKDTKGNFGNILANEMIVNDILMDDVINDKFMNQTPQ